MCKDALEHFLKKLPTVKFGLGVSIAAKPRKEHCIISLESRKLTLN
jgi:hypothetical protein